MSDKIKCQICNKDFRQINTTHLKSHNITQEEYKEKYGGDSLMSEEVRLKRSLSASGKNNANYGKYKAQTKEQAEEKKQRKKTIFKVKCRICDKEMIQVTNTHLKKHNMTTDEYIQKFGSECLTSQDIKNEKRELNKGSNNPNYGNKWQWSDVYRKQREENGSNISHIKGKTFEEYYGKERAKEIIQKQIDTKKDMDLTPDIKGKTFEEYYGKEKSNEIKEKLREAGKGTYEEKFGEEKAKELKRKISERQIGKEGWSKGKTYEELYGEEKAQELKKIISEKGKKREYTEEQLQKKKEIARNNARKGKEKAIQKRIDLFESIGYELIEIEENNIMKIKCNNNHIFKRSFQYGTKSVFKKEMCPVCHPPKENILISKEENEIKEFLEQFVDIERNNRSVLGGKKELDILIPKYNLAIEYDGLYWHREEQKGKDYHLYKTNKCEENNIQLIHIFEDEWINKRDIVESRLMSVLGLSKKIYARKCKIKEIYSKVSNKFIQENHIQGKGRANIHIGLFYENELISVMTFLKGDISKKIKGWELNRFCSKKGYNVIGGASKMFKYFISNYNPEQVISFADRRWSSNINGNVYEKLNFKFEYTTSVNYWYFRQHETDRFHRFGLRKLKNSILSERELREKEGWLRIYDCGSLKYIWKKEREEK